MLRSNRGALKKDKIGLSTEVCRYTRIHILSIIDKVDKLTLSLCNLISEGLSSDQVQCPAENVSGVDTFEHGEER